MKPSSELFELIKSMTAQEKRYFKLSASLQSGEKKYIRLFDLIDKQEKYDENKLKHKLIEPNLIKNIAYTKNYLYKLICRSLIQFRNDLSVDSRLSNLYERSKILYEKALFDQYFKTVKSGKQLAEKHERFGYLIEFLEIERQLVKKEDMVRKKSDRFYKEELLILEKIRNLNEYRSAVSDILDMHRSIGIIRTREQKLKLKELMQQIETESKNKPGSITATERLYYAMYLLNSISGDFRSACNYAEKRKEIILQHPEVFEGSLTDSSKESVYELTRSYIISGNYRTAKKYVEQYRSLAGKSELDMINIKLLELFLEIAESQVSGISDHRKTAEQAQRFLRSMKGKITIITLNELTYRLAYLAFRSKDFIGAVRLLDSMLSTKNMKLTPQIEVYVRMLLVLSHYELGNYKLLSFLIPSTAKLFKKKKMLYDLEATVLRHLRKIIGIKREEFVLEHLQLLADEIIKENAFDYSVNAAAYLDYNEWILRKLREMNVTANVCLR